MKNYFLRLDFITVLDDILLYSTFVDCLCIVQNNFKKYLE